MRNLEILISMLHLLQIFDQIGYFPQRQETDPQQLSNLGKKIIYFISPNSPGFVSKLLLLTIYICKMKYGLRYEQLPGISLSLMLALLQISGRHSMFYFNYESSSPENYVFILDVFKYVLAGLSIITNILQWYLLWIFGTGDFEKVKLSGQYSVGHKLYYTSRFGSPVSVYYPVDPEYEKQALKQNGIYAYKKWLEYNNPTMFLIYFQECQRWIQGSSKYRESTEMITYWSGIRTKALNHGQLADDFAKGKKKLVPFIFCHGFGQSRSQFSLIGQELASNGYLVFIPDFQDGSCIYLEKLKSGAEIFDYTLNCNSYTQALADKNGHQLSLFENKLKRREIELEQLISDIQIDKFITKVLRFEHHPLLDSSQLILSGQEIGAATCYKVALKESKVSMIIAHDPENNILMKDFKNEEARLKQLQQKRSVVKVPCLITNSETYLKDLDSKKFNLSDDLITSQQIQNDFYKNFFNQKCFDQIEIKGSIERVDFQDFGLISPFHCSYKMLWSLKALNSSEVQKRMKIFQFCIHQWIDFLQKKNSFKKKD